MDAHRLVNGRRQADRLALGTLRIVLAVVFAAVGCSFLMMPGLAADLLRAGYGPSLRLLVGVSHLAVGISLLSPRLAAGATFVLGSIVIWFTVRCLPGGEVPVPVGPALLTLALLVLAVWCQLRRRAEISAWHAMLDRYARRGERSSSG
jgi:hypothetical protein